jgi:hypothetical protein
LLQRLRIAVAILTGLAALLGLAYNGASLASSLAMGFNDPETMAETPYIAPAYYIMSAVCVVSYVLLIWGSYRMARGSTLAPWLLIGVWLFEIVYFLGVNASWLHPEWGMSIAAATGIANGGMMVQFMILLPIWGPIVVLFLRDRPQRSVA